MAFVRLLTRDTGPTRAQEDFQPPRRAHAQDFGPNQARQRRKAKRRVSESIRVQLPVLNPRGRRLVDAEAAANATHNRPPEGTLWVDRYRPKRFTELLGDEVRTWPLEWK